MKDKTGLDVSASNLFLFLFFKRINHNNVGFGFCNRQIKNAAIQKL